MSSVARSLRWMRMLASRICRQRSGKAVSACSAAPSFEVIAAVAMVK